MVENIKTTSSIWYGFISDMVKILDFAGWGENDFDYSCYSWSVEKITAGEFMARLMASTIEFGMDAHVVSVTYLNLHAMHYMGIDE